MRIVSIIVVLCFFYVFKSFAQTNPKKGMTYDKENAMYYHISHDDQYLYLHFYKDEYAGKAIDVGGIKLFFNTAGKKDTLHVPSIVYPVYKHPKRDYEIIAAYGFRDIPDGEISVYNEYGITGETRITENPEKNRYARDRSIFEGRISIPLEQFRMGGNKQLYIMVLLRGIRLFARPSGVVSPFTVSTGVNSTAESKAFFLDVDTWTHTWIDYELK
ncbi:hypothetical protein [Sphingobacterium paucimobilis]|uniref:Uncharacterized protein n=1 Tax=Sphingobacterium paucimobilis HER1398 TaxID=1346330 RepID=U2J5G7_9SPHI|nr:hypothetical protein [Sphingobacterium paucimobilis]ERJ57908.1 hypothetical protein M472_03925 [Sphingobacterium paucimobilis HER1398]